MAEAPRPMPPVRRLSGMLIISIFLSLGGFLFLPVLGPAVGAFCAWFGRRKALENPLLIGPRFGSACLAIALACIPVQGFFVYRMLPRYFFQEQVGKVHQAFFQRLENRDLRPLYDLLAASFREAHTFESVCADIAAAFPGEDKIAVEGNLDLRKDEFDDKKEGERFKEFLEQDAAKVEFRFPYLLKHGGGAAVLDLSIEVERVGHLSFEAVITGFTAKRAPAPPAPAAPAEAPATGTGSAAPPAPPPAPPPVPPAETGPALPLTHEIAMETEYYLTGPQQGRPADGRLRAGTKVALVKGEGSYSLVCSADGIKVYVSTDALTPLR